MIRWLVALAIVLGAGLQGKAGAETIHVAADRWEPFIFEKGGAADGIGVKIYQEIAAITGDEIHFDFLPNKRLRQGLDEQSILVVMLDSPVWNSVEQDVGYSYSQPLFNLKEMAFVKKGAERTFKVAADFTGLTIGTMDGYQYQDFEGLFDARFINRTNASSETALIKLLKLDRVDAVFMDEVVYGYHAQKMNIPRGLVVPAYLLSDVPVSIKVRDDRPDLLRRFNAAISDLKTAGRISEIIAEFIGLDTVAQRIQG